MRVTYRQIASYLVSALPTYSPKEFSSLVDDSTKAIEAIPAEARVALKSAYIFSHTRQVPVTERADLFQDLTLAVLKAKTKSEALAYTIARYDWKNWIAKCCWRQRILSGDNLGLDTQSENNIVSNGRYQDMLDANVDASRVFNSLPVKIKLIINKRLGREGLSAAERQRLSRYLKRNGTKIRAMLSA